MKMKSMSLLRQLLLSLSLALLGILAGTLALNLSGARSYLSEQLQSQSENAITALALSLSQPASQDPAMQELLMSALFDTGQFESVRMLSPEGVLVFERQQAASSAAAQVPGWFQRLMPVPRAHSERTVSNGWNQLGRVAVTVDNQVAQQVLWHSSLKMTALIVGAGLAWACFVGLLLRWFKRVLKDSVESEVMRIGADEADAAVQVPQVPELAGVATAIHDARSRVQQKDRAQRDRIESLELETNSDAITQLPNRKYFVNELKKALQMGGQTHGHVLLMRLRDLQALNSTRPREQVDEWLRGIAQQLREQLRTRGLQQVQIARLNGSDFAVLFPQMTGMSVMQEVQQLRQLLQSLRLRLDDGQWSRNAFSLTAYMDSDHIGDVLSRLDQGLMQAESAGHGEVEYAEPSVAGHAIHQPGEGQWQTTLGQALQHADRLSVAVPAAAHASLVDTRVLHEAGLELHEAGGKTMGAALFLPAAVRLGLSAEYDLKAVQLGLQWLALQPKHHLVVRISQPSLEQGDFLERLSAQLQAKGWCEVLPQLTLELDAFALEVAPLKALQFCEVVTQAGASVGCAAWIRHPRRWCNCPSYSCSM
nr:LapD/MoxY N-terminal periplasmic domain-containing protein [Comamonas jiangduensis]